MPDTETDAPAPEQTPQPEPPKPAAPEFKAPRDQDEFDRMVGARLERERAKFSGFEDYKAKAEQFDTLQQEQMSELEKAQTAAAKAQRRAEHAELSLIETAIRSSVIAEASKAGAVDPDAVVALIDSNAVTIDDAGQVTGADTAVAALLEAKPYLQANQPAPPSNFDAGPRSDGHGNGTGQPWQVQSRDELRGKSPEEIEALRVGGHLNQLQGITQP